MTMYSKRTKEECIRSAMHFDSTVQWRRGDGRCYAYARRHGWMAECCRHMPQYGRFHDAALEARRRTREECIESAARYPDRKEWIAAEPKMYDYACRHGWIAECTAHMKDLRGCSSAPRPRKHSLEECHMQARGYSRRVDWDRAPGSLYSYAWRHGWLGICCAHMERCNPVGNLKRAAHTKEQCIESARRYTTQQQWHDNASGYYYRAYRMHWMDECCAHMEVHRRSRHTLEECIRSASGYETRKAWREGDGTLYLYAVANRWMELCCAHMPDMRYKAENQR